MSIATSTRRSERRTASPSPQRNSSRRQRRWLWWPLTGGACLIALLVATNHARREFTLLNDTLTQRDQRLAELTREYDASLKALEADRALYLARVAEWARFTAHDPQLALRTVTEGADFALARGLDSTGLREFAAGLPPTRKVPANTRVEIVAARTTPGATVVDLTVRSARGEFVPGLTRADFEVRHGDRRVHALSVNSITKTAERWSVALLLDTSASVKGEPLRAEQRGAQQLARAIANPGRVRVWAFADKVEVLTPWTYDADVLGEAIGALRAGGGTALYKALRTASQDASHWPGRKAIVLFTDGQDSFHAEQLEPILANCATHQTAVHVVMLNAPEKNEPLLRAIAQRTRGTFHRADTPEAITTKFQEITQALQQPAYRLVWLESANRPVSIQLGELPPLAVAALQ